MTSRRRFLAIVPAATAALGFSRTAWAADPPLVDEKDSTAASLGYVADAARADKAKYKTWAAGQACGNCQLFQGKPAAASGPCPLYAGKQVSAKGWCSAYVRKAA